MSIHPYREYKPFIEKLEEEGRPYDATPEERVKGGILTVIYKKENGYEACRLFYKGNSEDAVRDKLLAGRFPKYVVKAVMDEKDQINTHCLTFMREIVPKWPLNIILSGPEQIGKTYASVWLAKHLFEQRIIFEPYFVRASELRKEKNEEGYWGFNYPREADYLVVDDLGSETVITQFSTENQDKRALIFEVIDFRTGNELCTIITTNLSPEYLRTRYSIKTISRLENNGVIKEFPKL